MIVTVVNVHVIPGKAEEFLKFTKYNHDNAIKEDGNLRFDVLQSRDDPNHFILYEAYATDEAAKAHKDTEHYKKWREGVAEFMESPREGIPCDALFPEDFE
ncbi:MAG: antibiotic biosynthesis monooxygenase [Clostridia bacterium]|nr:antibiotic biosynthesis monooxygenase [Clostridia bacterium]